MTNDIRPPVDLEDEAKQDEGLDTTRAPLMEHLIELRSRLFKALGGVLVVTLLALIWQDQLFQFFHFTPKIWSPM